MLLKYLLHLCLALLVLGQFTRFSRGEFSLYISDIAVLSFGLVGFIFFILKKNLYVSYSFLLYTIFILYCLVTLFLKFEVYSINQLLVAASYIVRLASYLGAAVVVSNMLRNNYLNKTELLNILIFYSLAFAFFGFIQYIILPDFSTLDPKLGWDPHKYRLTGTFFDPNFAGAFIVLGLLALLFKIDTKKSLNFNDFLIGFSLLSAILLTYSRSAWLMLAAIIFILGFKYKEILVFSLFIFFAAYLAVPRIQTRLSGTTDPADSAHFRLISWKNAYSIYSDNKMFGVGFNAYRYAQNQEKFLNDTNFEGNSGAGADSSFLLVLATTGVIGFILFLVSYLFPIVESQAGIYVFALLFSLALNTQFINSLFYPQILFYMFILIEIFSNQLNLRKLL